MSNGLEVFKRGKGWAPHEGEHSEYPLTIDYRDPKGHAGVRHVDHSGQRWSRVAFVGGVDECLLREVLAGTLVETAKRTRNAKSRAVARRLAVR